MVTKSKKSPVEKPVEEKSPSLTPGRRPHRPVVERDGLRRDMFITGDAEPDTKK